MKIFWSLVALLVLAAAAVLVFRASGPAVPPVAPQPAATGTRPPAPPAPPIAAQTSESAVEPTPSLPVAGDTAPTPSPDTPANDVRDAVDDDATTAEATSDPVETANTDTAPSDDTAEPAPSIDTSVPRSTGGITLVTSAQADEALAGLPDLDTILGVDEDTAAQLLAERETPSVEDPADADTASDQSSTATAAQAPNGTPPAPPGPNHTPSALVNPTATAAAKAAAQAQADLLLDEAHAKAEPIAHAEDGTLILGGRYRVPGSGTPADPYKVSWDLLISVKQSYDPASGRTKLPEWTAALDGKHIELSGFVLFPVMDQSSDEVLLMYNQWDGCCIGVPPTPYDAIEVRLKQAPRNVPRWAVNYGTLKGRFDVDPYLVSNWLVGLYLLDAGELELAGL